MAGINLRARLIFTTNLIYQVKTFLPIALPQTPAVGRCEAALQPALMLKQAVKRRAQNSLTLFCAQRGRPLMLLTYPTFYVKY
jgi:hypothetical protein